MRTSLLVLLSFLALCLRPGSAQAQMPRPASCGLTATISATGRTVLAGPSGSGAVWTLDPTNYASVRLYYRTTGSPGGVAIQIEDSMDAAATVTPWVRGASITSTTAGDWGFIPISGTYLFANTTTLSGGSSPTIVIRGCFQSEPIAKAITGATTGTTLTLSGMTQGSVPFFGAAGLLSQNNAKLFWDNTNFRLGIGTASPATALHIAGDGQLRFSGTGSFAIAYSAGSLAVAFPNIRFDTGNLVLNPGGAASALYYGVDTFPAGHHFYGAGAAGETVTFDTNGAVSLSSVITTYKGVAKDVNHNGVPFTGWSDSKTAQSANLAATTLIASATAGRYRANCYVAVTQQATTSSTVPNCNLICTDPTDSVAKTIQLTPAIAGVAANPTTAVGESDSGICDAKAATAIQYSTTNYASVGATAMQYKLYIVLEIL